jgi:hypothetical protein
MQVILIVMNQLFDQSLNVPTMARFRFFSNCSQSVVIAIGSDKLCKSRSGEGEMKA